ncbi:Transcription factor MYB30 [Vitis vinifera]|uniref:Transcription factor MYB30 n=1 Tax=Vitis vinifera TaxID=29760 RepID=A0A438BQK6_VITVI|nr:Transcription factor MYB30 [Vitis vinifera]
MLLASVWRQFATPFYKFRFSVSQTDNMKATLFYKFPEHMTTMKQPQPSTLFLQGLNLLLTACFSMALLWKIHDDIPTLAGLSRSGKSCTERWNNHLDPNVKRENFSQEEDDAIICFQSLYGNSWESIAAHLPGRTDNDVKNRWYNHLKKKKIGKISQEIANSWSTSELVYPEFAADHLMSDDEIIHHSFGGDYF